MPVEDGIVFDLAGIQGERIKEDAEYGCVRVRVPASLDGARISMQIDIGFGDLVDPPPVEITLPVLLPLDAPVIRCYPPEAVIAEKFHAMVVLGIANSRTKDFFDIWTLARSRQFDLDRLSHSVRSTFERRRTVLPRTAPLALTAEFLEDPSKQTQWLAFGKRLGLRGLPLLPLVGEQVAAFLSPVLGALQAADSGPWTWSQVAPGWAPVAADLGFQERLARRVFRAIT